MSSNYLILSGHPYVVCPGVLLPVEEAAEGVLVAGSGLHHAYLNLNLHLPV